MKKIIVMMLVGVMVFSLAACGSNNAGGDAGEEAAAQEAAVEEPEEAAEPEAEAEPEEAAEPEAEAEPVMAGAYTRADSPVITDETAALLEKATEGLLGAEYTPVAYIGSQIVAGMNHLLLCKVKTVTPEANETYALVTIYEDLEGNAKITDVINSDAEAGPPDLMGGWQTPETPELTDEAKGALEKATEKLLGAEYDPVALVATQVVAGMNYSILCEITAVAPDAEPKYSIVIVYQDLEGNAEVTDTFDFTLADE